jgi:hypothetical protein
VTAGVSPLTPASGPRISRARAIRPGLVDAVGENYSTLATMVDPICLELCRMRIAQILNDEAQLQTVAPGITQAQVDELARWRTSGAFGRKEKACLEFAEQFLYSADAVTDEQVDAVAEFFPPEQVWALTNAIAVSERFGRLAAFLESVDAREDA